MALDGFCECGCGGKTAIANRNRRQRRWVKGQPVPFLHGHNVKLSWLAKFVRFWSMTRPFPLNGRPDCIEWAGFITEHGYGDYYTGLFGETLAHRIAYVLTFGPIPMGLEPDHLCRNRVCVNPFHLEAVTRKTNARRGAKCKLNEQSVVDIRTSGDSTRTLMRRYNVSRATIQAARSGRSWS